MLRTQPRSVSRSPCLRVSPSFRSVPRLQHQPPRAVFAEFGEFLFLEHAEGLAGEIRTIHIRRIEDVAQLVAGQAVGAGKPGVQFGAELGAAGFVPGEWRVASGEWRVASGEG